MTVLHPCHNCHRKSDCSIRAKTLAALKGLSITKATLQCRLPQKDFPPGSVVEVKVSEVARYEDNERPRHYIKSTIRQGIVMRWQEGRAVVALDRDHEFEQPRDEIIGILKVNSDRLTATGPPPVDLCSCGLSQTRCDAGDYPSVRGGKFRCGSEQE